MYITYALYILEALYKSSEPIWTKGSGRVKIGPVKIAKFQSRKIIDVLSFLICLNFELSETL